MGIKINYQGILAEKTGITTESISKIETSSKVLEAIVNKHPSLKNLNFVVAVNGIISHGETEVKEGDSITLIPPAPGG